MSRIEAQSTPKKNCSYQHHIPSQRIHTYGMSFQLLHRKAPVCLAQHSADEVLRFTTEVDVVREEEMTPPFDDFAVYIVGVFGTERRVS
jgi:hypothetical protein